jgi:hypothetical protein
MIRIVCFFLQVFIIFLGGQTALGARQQWELVQDQGEVKIYERKTEGFSESEFKGVCTVNQPVEIIGAVLLDIPGYIKWFHNCSAIKKIPQIDSNDLDFILYVTINAPWPLLDRDIVYQTQVAVDIVAGKVTVKSAALKDPLVPIVKGCVRITDSELHWLLEKISPDRTRVTFAQRTNIGGAAGAFLSNSGSKMTIFDSLKNLRRIADDPKYAEIGKKIKKEYIKNIPF